MGLVHAEGEHETVSYAALVYTLMHAYMYMLILTFVSVVMWLNRPTQFCYFNRPLRKSIRITYCT